MKIVYSNIGALMQSRFFYSEDIFMIIKVIIKEIEKYMTFIHDIQECA